MNEINFCNIKRDKKTAKIIFTKYYVCYNDLTSILHYYYHSLFFENLGEIETARLLKKIALKDFFYFNLLTCVIKKLGIDPMFYVLTPIDYIFCNKTSKRVCKVKEKMLLDDVSRETLAVNVYEKILLEIKDNDLISIMSKMKKDRMLHIELLKKQLIDIKNG